MKTYKYILLALTLCLGFTACQEDEEVMMTNIQVSASANVTYTSVRIEATVTGKSSAVTYMEVQYSKNSNFSGYISEGMGVKNGKYVVNLYNLDSNTKYYFRFRAANRVSSMLCKYSSSFTTEQPSAPLLSELNVDDIRETSAHVYCNVLADGGYEVNERGFYYKRSTASSWTKVVADSGTGFFHKTLSLQDNTEYQVYAYASNWEGTSTSNVVTFTTLLVASAPTVTTTAASNVQIYTATLGGEVTDDGGVLVTEYGVVYTSDDSTPTLTNGTRVAMGGGSGSFSQAVTDLTAATTYRVRAYAINNIGISYGDVITFTTETAPTVSTYTNPEVTATSAVVWGNVENGTGDRGICYSLASNPTINDMVVYNGSGAGSYSCTLADLHPGTTYYARAFSNSSYGVTYGDEITFTTLTTDPVVETTYVTNVAAYSALVYCQVASDGGHAIIERGVCFNTSGSPTTSDMKVSNGVGVGSYSCELTGLSYGTTYYVRAYVITSTGTYYGETHSFTTN